MFHAACIRSLEGPFCDPLILIFKGVERDVYLLSGRNDNHHHSAHSHSWHSDRTSTSIDINGVAKHGHVYLKKWQLTTVRTATEIKR